MMDQAEYLASLFSFIDQSPTAFHVVANAAAVLREAGFKRLHETDSWQGLDPGKYMVERGDASLIAFTLAGKTGEVRSLRMAGAHTDSPSLRVKPQPMQLHQGCLQLGVEVYGGALLRPWFDRPLSLAGRVSWSTDAGEVMSSLLDFRQPLAIIPSLAIHLDREVNNGRAINKQTDLLPILGLSDAEKVPVFADGLKETLQEQHPQARVADILGFDLFCYDPAPVSRVGLAGELVNGSRLDNQLSCHALVHGLIAAEAQCNALIVLNDHEEVGSLSSAGAHGPFLKTVLERLFPNVDERSRVLAGSLLISADNAHAVHPNFAAKHDPEHMPRLNHGVVLKINANQRYATSGLTGALFTQLCRQAGVPCQSFVMRNDMACGSTIGPLTAAEVGVNTVDVGVPQLAMHSLRETVGDHDGWYLLRVLTTFFGAPDQAIRCPEVGGRAL